MVKREITGPEVEALLRDAAGIRCRVEGELTDGWFNAVFRIRTGDGRPAVAKIAPLPGTPVLRYERGIMSTEAMFCRQAGALRGVPVPELLGEGPGFLVMSEIAGAPWAKAAGSLGARERGALLRELGQIIARLHALPCPDGRFGCPAPEAGLLAADWPAAFTAMVGAILEDAARWDSPIGISPAKVRELIAGGAGALGEVREVREVREASLAHFDLWPGNVFISGTRPRVTGIIDHERAFWGDPAAELVSPEICGPAGPGSALAAGYAEAGGQLTFTPALRHRLALYRLYFGLILVVECGPRGYTPDHVTWCRSRLDSWAAALRELRAARVPAPRRAPVSRAPEPDVRIS
jgi:aminoglycoside phosphotransferase (APT) family kinase protein